MTLSRPVVAATVFGASAAVLTLEILSVRLLAPYVGLTIETYTTIIGVALAGIAAGAAVGGRLADRTDPSRLIGVLLAGGGVLGMLSVPLVAWIGDAGHTASAADALVIALVTLGPPAAVLSAVTPAAVKLEVADLDRTGTEVGRISAWATAGALTGTFVTGFVLVPLLSSRTSVLVVGAACVVAGLALGARIAFGAAAAGVAAIGLAVGTGCDRDSAYFCARVVDDGGSRRVLVLDDLRHSYVDLDDPRHLEFAYTRWIGQVIDAARPREAVFIGGGGFTLPRYLNEVVRGSRATVLELDPDLVDLARDELGLRESERLRVQTGDARVRLREVDDDSADLVVGDAFGSRAIPWHLATREFVRDVRRVLRPRGVYALNVIDHGPLDLARAEVATLQEGFAHVGLISDEDIGGNIVLVASDAPLPAPVTHGEEEVTRFAGDADPLTDDHAPADQLLTPTSN